VNLVLRVQPTVDDGFAAQIYQSATGKDFGSQPFEPGGSIAIDDTTFTFEPAAYVIVSLANQPSHWIIALGLIGTLAGLVGVLIWPDAASATRRDRITLVLTRVSWPLITLLFIGVSSALYPRTASLSAGSMLTAWEVSLAAWLLASGSAITAKAARLFLVALALISTLLAGWLLLAARG
jgi:hypothetical protein